MRRLYQWADFFGILIVAFLASVGLLYLIAMAID